MILIDTGYLIGVADRGDELHDLCRTWSKRIVEPMILTEYILLEAVNHFSFEGTRAQARAIVDWVYSDPMVEMIEADSTLFAAGLRLHRARPDKDWSLTDCISFQVMRERHIAQALAYDIHFEQAGFDALLRRDPPV